MPISINGTGTITGISAGGLPDDCITTADIAGSAVTTAKLAQPMTLETAKAYNWNGLTTNTSLDFTGIPSWVKKVTVMFNGVSTSGANVYLIQIGSGSFVTSGYATTTVYTGSSTSGMSGTAGFYMWNGASAEIHSGTYIISQFSGTTYVGSGVYNHHAQTYISTGAGVSPALSGVLDRVRLTTQNGTDTFDSGSVNIMYEG